MGRTGRFGRRGGRPLPLVDGAADEDDSQYRKNIGLNGTGQQIERHQRNGHQKPGQRQHDTDDEDAAHDIAEQAHDEGKGAGDLFDNVERDHYPARLGKSLQVTEKAVCPDAETDGGGEDDEETEYVPSDDPEYEAELEARAEEYAKRRSENMKSGEPYLIEPEEYVDGPEDYDRQALYYYAKDRTLCEDDDQEVEEEEACVGLDYEDVLDMQTTCWVRNDRLRVLYEIHRINDSYKEVVLNARETPREREFRIQSRRKQALDDKA